MIGLELVRNGRNVGRDLAIDIERAATLLPFVLNPPDARRPNPRPAKCIKAEKADAMLAPYRPDVESGVPDMLIAARAKVSSEVVRAWRRRQQIPAQPGGRPHALLRAYELQNLLGGPAPRHPHTTTGHLEAFEAPTYVLREPLDYSAFVRVVATLRASGLTVREIANGIGVLDRDVAQAVHFGERRQAR